MNHRHDSKPRHLGAGLCRIGASILAAGTLAMAGSATAESDSRVDSVGAAREVLELQRQAWNRADIDAFMASYWRGDDLRFAGGDQFRTGWQATIDRYRATYPDAAAMGELDFELIEVRALAPDVVYVFGRWALQRDQDAVDHRPHGLFTLIVEPKDGRWVITRDHTSSAE